LHLLFYSMSVRLIGLIFIATSVVVCCRRIREMVLTQPLHVTILNTPKCATGSLQMMFESLLRCPHPFDDNGEGYIRHSCPNGDYVIRSHDINATVDFHRSAKQGGRCVVVSAYREPKMYLRSQFFQARKRMLCDGYDDIPELLEEFRGWAELFNPKTYSAPVVAELFGVNFSSVIQAANRDGGVYHQKPKRDRSVLGHCELLMLQVERMTAAFPQIAKLFPGMVEPRVNSFDTMCPKSKDVRDAIKNYRLPQDVHNRLYGPGSQMGVAAAFYGDI